MTKILVQLYKQADLAIQPSRMEGFGLTALEAMASGAPVIAANAGALPEVVGDARALFDPGDPAAIAGRITQILSDSALARSLVEQGIARAENFSWERTARLAVDALQAAARQPGEAMPDLGSVRRITRSQLGPWPRCREGIARVLAAAEPRTSQAPRLLIDVSHTSPPMIRAPAFSASSKTSRAGCCSKAICARNSSGAIPPTVLIPRKSTRRESCAGRKLRQQSSDRPAAGDHILMLDSSWNLFARFS